MEIKRALISVYNKNGLKELVQALHEKKVEIISTGGTGNFLTSLNIPYIKVEKITDFPECFGGRVKTLSGKLLGGVLYNRDNNIDIHEAKELKVPSIDLVVVNLYPFGETLESGANESECIEKIDIGGPTMIRAAAKNFAHVTVLSDPEQYTSFISHFKNNTLSLSYRRDLAGNVFRLVSDYDSAVANFFHPESNIHIDLKKTTPLRYGENPHQKAWVKGELQTLQGRELSYNNYLDIDAAIKCISDLKIHFGGKFSSVVVKHSNPCGLAVSDTLLESLNLAWAGDSISAFGGIIGFSHQVDLDIAKFLKDKFVEVIIAPSFTHEALNFFKDKKNLRIIAHSMMVIPCTEVKTIVTGTLIQTPDVHFSPEFMTVTTKKVPADFNLLNFGQICVKHIKSNAITLVHYNGKSMQQIGAGMGNPNRLLSTQEAIEKAKTNKANLSELLLVSDAFFPFVDNVELAAAAGIKNILQPGGSIRDQEIIAKADELGISMCFTGRRHFKH